MAAETNLEKYNDPEVVAYYVDKTGLQPCEELLFERWLNPGLRILDIGFGGGRTTPFLSKRGRHYVGVDYSQAMVDACSKRFPGLEFRHGDATDLSQFADGEFDAVVFSFNGIDCIRTDEARARCLKEVARVLNVGGVFIFSSHNPQALGVLPLLAGARGMQIPWRILYSLFASLRLTWRSVRGDAFWRGGGYLLDSVHGGLVMYAATPEKLSPQIQSAGLEVLEIVGGRYPDTKLRYFTPWYYYACRKSG